MSQIANQIQNQVSNVPGLSTGLDITGDYWNDYAEEHFKQGNPYKNEETGKRLTLDHPLSTVQEKRLFREVQKRAWFHDKCFLGSCGGSCFWDCDCTIGMAPILVAILPAIGPFIMYAIHARLIQVVSQECLIPNKLRGKMESNIFIDMLITFPPIIGGFFSWLNGCLTKNAHLIYCYFMSIAEQRAKSTHFNYSGSSDPRKHNQQLYKGTAREKNYKKPPLSNNNFTNTQVNPPKPGVHVGQQQTQFV